LKALSRSSNEITKNSLDDVDQVLHFGHIPVRRAKIMLMIGSSESMYRPESWGNYEMNDDQFGLTQHAGTGSQHVTVA
jgi:hypothetical protein